MLAALYSWSFVAGGTELWLLFWAACAAGYAAICLFPKKTRKIARKPMVLGLLLAELVVDVLCFYVYAAHPGIWTFGIMLVYGLIPYALTLLVSALVIKIRYYAVRSAHA